ncbi:MAG: MFS transporter [Bacteroidaceae bacterium]|nr:MFS transporter [Bacteroidaceae bacterium]
METSDHRNGETTTGKSPKTWVPTLYFAMGLPFVVLNMVTTLMYKGLNVSDTQIAFWTSLVMLPWTLKPLWSPLLEMYRTKKFFVVATQLTSGLLFGMVALALHLPHFFAVTVALFFVVAMSGATHDIAADGVYMQVLSEQEQAQYIGWQGAFYNIAKIVGTGLLVSLAGVLIERIGVAQSWTMVMMLVAVLLAGAGLYHAFVLPETPHTGQGASATDFWTVFRDFFRKRHIAYYIAFIVLYRLAEGFVMKIVPLFLKASRGQQGLGLTEKEIGLLYGTFGAAAFVLGSILAGYYIAHRGLRRSLFRLALVFNLPFVAYTLLALYQPESQWLVGTAIVLEYFGYGFGFVGLTLFMMQQVAPGRHQTAHYALASGIMNLGVMLPGMVSGAVSDWLGYRLFFVLVLLCTIPALLVTWFVPFTYQDNGPTHPNP